MNGDKDACKEKALLEYLSLLETLLGDLKFTFPPQIYRGMRIESAGAMVCVVADVYDATISPTTISLKIFAQILCELLKSESGGELLPLISEGIEEDVKDLLEQGIFPKDSLQLIRAMKAFNDCFETDFSKVRKVVSESFDRDKRGISWLKSIHCRDDELLKSLDRSIAEMSAIREIIK